MLKVEKARLHEQSCSVEIRNSQQPILLAYILISEWQLSIIQKQKQKSNRFPLVTILQTFKNCGFLEDCTGCPKIIVPCLCGYCGGAVDSIISVFTQLHRSGFNLEFQTLFESIGQVVADIWQRKGKISGYFKKQHFYCSTAMSK